MILTYIISFLLSKAIPGLSLQVCYELCRCKNEGIPITPFLIWKKARTHILLLILAVILVIPLSLYAYLNMPLLLMIHLLLLLCQVGIFLMGKLADYFHKNKDGDSQNNKMSA
ncbi:hypothetical protein EXW28_28040 (plasmid) [Bacillus mycoides]|nr:hypothetical protein EXW37_28035 [Bacillus mycoides]QWH37435.1 hypothetical protein EXW28_28040 [Bacillus mycoides]